MTRAMGAVRGSAVALAITVAEAGACGHATRTEATTSPPTGIAARPAAKPAAKPDRSVAPAAGGAPLATGPAGLLEPGAAARIQEALSARGKLGKAHRSGALDTPTREALRAFQSANQLPATGVPDDATVAKLGLSPADVFRSAAGK